MKAIAMVNGMTYMYMYVDSSNCNQLVGGMNVVTIPLSV